MMLLINKLCDIACVLFGAAGGFWLFASSMGANEVWVRVAGMAVIYSAFLVVALYVLGQQPRKGG